MSDTPIRVMRGFTHSKREGEPNEDHWCSSPDGAICALSDGASVSFDPAPWADLLTRKFVDDRAISRDWLSLAVTEYEAAYDREAMEWMQQGAFDRGSFATLLGVVVEGPRSAKAFAIGDSLLALVQSGQVVRTLPYTLAAEFDASPLLLSTSPRQNADLADADLELAWHELALDEGATLFLMTDALGRWLLDDPSADRVRQLFELTSDAEFSAFVEHERLEGRLRLDDITLVVVA